MCGSRRKKRKGRRSVWEERHANDLLDAVISSSDYYKKKLIFTEKRKIRITQKYTLMCSKNWSRDIEMVASRLAQISAGTSSRNAYLNAKERRKGALKACGLERLLN